MPDGQSCKEINEIVQKNMLIEEITITDLKIEIHAEWQKLIDTTRQIKKLKIEYITTYLIEYVSHQITPVIHMIQEYVGLSL